MGEIKLYETFHIVKVTFKVSTLCSGTWLNSMGELPAPPQLPAALPLRGAHVIHVEGFVILTRRRRNLL